VNQPARTGQDVELNDYMKRFKELDVSQIYNKTTTGKNTCCGRKPVFYSDMFKQAFDPQEQSQGQINHEDGEKKYTAKDADIADKQKQALLSLDVETFNMLQQEKEKFEQNRCTHEPTKATMIANMIYFSEDRKIQ